MKVERTVPKLRFQEFTEVWKWHRLAECFEERTERKQNADDELLSVTISDGVIRQADTIKKNTASSDTSNYKMVYSGDIAYNSMRMWQGAEGVSSYIGIVSPAYTVITPLTGYDSLFFSFMFKREKMLKTFERYSQGLTSDTWNLKYPAFSRITVAVPSLIEQQQIAGTLTKLDALITLQQHKLDQIKEYKKGMLQKMFPKEGESVPEVRFPGFTGEWERHKLSELCENITVGIANSATHAYRDNGIVMFRNQNIKENYLDDSDVIYIDEDFEKKYVNKRLKANDILVARTGYPGTACVVPEKYDGSQTFTTLIVRLKAGINPYFVCQYINSDYGKKYISATQIGGGQKNSGARILEELPVVLPYQTEEQSTIARFLTNLDTLITLHQRKLEAMNEYKKGLLQQMFV